MPWCPNCKNEYKDGYTVCSDCGATLVDSLSNSMNPIYFASSEVMDEIERFIKSNDLSGYEVKYDDKECQSVLYATEDSKAAILKALKVYLNEIMAKEDPEYIEELERAKEEKEHPSIYVKPEKRAEEYFSGAVVLLLVGVLGAVVLALMDLGIIPAVFGGSNILLNVVMGTLFGVFIITGISSFASYKKLKEQVSVDDKTTDEIFAYFDSMNIDDLRANDSSDESDEVNFFARTDIIRSIIDDKFEDVSDDFKEHIIEEIYNKYFL